MSSGVKVFWRPFLMLHPDVYFVHNLSLICVKITVHALSCLVVTFTTVLRCADFGAVSSAEILRQLDCPYGTFYHASSDANGWGFKAK